MIITRSPLRVSLGGGGTDLLSYSRRHGGFLIAAAVDKYVYINIHTRFVDGFLLKYSQLEEASSIDDIRHPIIREALRTLAVDARNLEITSMADIPAGTGLGSSGSFTTALLKALHAFERTSFILSSSPSRHVISRSICCTSRSADRINTSLPMAELPVSSSMQEWVGERVASKYLRGNIVQPGRQPSSILYRILQVSINHSQRAG